MTTASLSRRIEYMDLASVPRAERNPRVHDLARIRSSMKAYGCTVAGILDERTETLVVGHGRLMVLEAMLKEGAAPPDGVIDNGSEWLVPIVRGWASANDDEAKGFLVTDNRIQELGGWDNRLLAEILDEVAEYNLDLLDIAGYDHDFLDKLLVDSGVYADRTSNFFDNAFTTRDPSSEGGSEEGFSSDPGEEGDYEDASDPDGGSSQGREVQFVQVSWIVNVEQRKIVRQALSRAQKLFELDTSAEALCAMAERFLETHPEEEEVAA